MPLALGSGGGEAWHHRGWNPRRQRDRRPVWAASSSLPDAGDDGLAAMLSAIAADVQRHAGALADGIRAEFAIRMLDATRRMPRHQVAATLKALREMQSATLAAVSQNAAAEIQGRQAVLKTKSARSGPKSNRSVMER
jgi:hypothetical protein